MNDTAVRWTLEQANADDARDRVAAAQSVNETSLLQPLLVGRGSVTVSILSRNAFASASTAEASSSPPRSVWAVDASLHTPGTPSSPFLSQETGDSKPFHRTDVLHTSHGNVLASTPWFVAVDRGRRALVISVRGTLSIDDAITDALALPICVGEELKPALAYLASCGTTIAPSTAYVHAGMWQASGSIYAALLKHGLLEAAASGHVHGLSGAIKAGGNGIGSSACRPGDQSPEMVPGTTAGHPKDYASPMPRSAPFSEPCADTRKCGLQDLQLVITGHSLGAGVAALLALRLLPHFPALRCYAFSPPGAVASATLASAMESFVMSPFVCCAFRENHLF